MVIEHSLGPARVGSEGTVPPVPDETPAGPSPAARGPVRALGVPHPAAAGRSISYPSRGSVGAWTRRLAATSKCCTRPCFCTASSCSTSKYGNTQQGIGPTDDPVDLRDFWAHSWRVDVLRCTRSPLPPEAHRRRTAERLHGTYAEIDAGHYPMLSHPQEIADYLIAR